MKTTRYRFEQAVQEVTLQSIEWLRGEFRSILESDKDFTRKADYIGFSMLSVDNRIASLDEEIKELQQLKKNLKDAKTITATVGAEVIAEYGIDKIEGAGISSITVTKSSNKTFQIIEVQNEEAMIQAGYFQKIVDEDKILGDFNGNYNKEFIKQHCKVLCQTVVKLPYLKINKRRSAKQMEVAL